MPGERSITAVAVDLQYPGKITQMSLSAFRLAVGGIDISNHRRVAPTPWAIIAGIGPELTGLGPAAPRIKHWRSRLVGE